MPGTAPRRRRGSGRRRPRRPSGVPGLSSRSCGVDSGRLPSRASSAATSTSLTWSKSRYQSPTERKCSGVRSTTTSSAASRSSSPQPVGPTGAAKTTRAAPRERAALQAARAVEPVATPSSTTTTVRPASGSGGRSPRQRPRQACDLCGSGLLGDVVRLRRDAGPARHVLLDDAGPLLADGAHGQLGPVRHAHLADDHHVQRRVQGLGDPRGDRHATAGESQHDRVVEGHGPQALAQSPPGLVPVGEDPRVPACSGPHPATVSRAPTPQAGALVPTSPRQETCRLCVTDRGGQAVPRREGSRPRGPAANRVGTAAASRYSGGTGIDPAITGEPPEETVARPD